MLSFSIQFSTEIMVEYFSIIKPYKYVGNVDATYMLQFWDLQLLSSGKSHECIIFTAQNSGAFMQKAPKV